MMSSSEEEGGDSGIQAKSLDELEEARKKLMEQLLSLPDDSQEPLSPIPSPLKSWSPSPKKPRLSTSSPAPNERAAAGRDSSAENGIHVDSSLSPVSELKEMTVGRPGCSSPVFASQLREEERVWRTEVVINNCVCGSGEGETKDMAEACAARAVLEKYTKDEGDTSLDKSMESLVNVTDDSLSDEDPDERYSAGESDLDIDELLEKPFGEGGTRECPVKVPVNGRRRKAPMFREKIVLKHRSTEYFEVLPDGWIEVTHRSGLPVYLHKMSRVCTFSRPYFIGPGSVRNHDVPVASIPCLHQKRVREKEEAVSQTLNGTEEKESSDALKRLGAPQVKLQTAKDFKTRNLNPNQLHEYASKAFQFEKAKLWRFRSWSESRNHHKKRREQLSETLQNLGRPSLPSDVKLITVPSMDARSKPTQKQFFLNPRGKTSIAVLHEYVQKVLKGTVKYVFIETKNAGNPYGVTVKVIPGSKQRVPGGTHEDEEEVELGSGYGNSKKIAKMDGAKKALQVLIPGLDFDEEGMVETGAQQDDAVALFDLIPVTDTRVGELSAKSGQPAPFVILQECLKRHSAFGNTRIETRMDRTGHQTHHYTMKVGKHEVLVSCTNKKEGKQKASQFMLEKLHTQIKTWGSLLRLYGYGAQRKLQETRKEKDSIIKLQGQTRPSTTEPNHAILDKLKEEMGRLYPDSPQTTAQSPSSSKRLAALRSIDI